MKDVIDIAKIIDLNEYDIDHLLSSDVIQLNSLLDKTVVILGFEKFSSKKYNSTGVKLRVIFDGEERTCRTCAKVIVK